MLKKYKAWSDIAPVNSPNHFANFKKPLTSLWAENNSVIKLKLISEGFGAPQKHELTQLKSNNGKFFIREVIIYSGIDNKPLELARVCVPHKTFTKFRTQLLNLKEKFIGEDFFKKQPNFSKTNFIFSQAKICEGYLGLIKNNFNTVKPDAFYSVRSYVADIDGYQLCLTEVFL